MAELAASLWTNWCRHFSCIHLCAISDEMPVVLLDYDLVTPHSGVCGYQFSWCGIGEKDDNEKTWEVLMII